MPTRLCRKGGIDWNKQRTFARIITMQRRVLSLWFPRLPSDRALRLRAGVEAGLSGPFALTVHQQNALRIHCLTPEAEMRGIARGMALSQARALCPELASEAADMQEERRFLTMLVRWAGRYCPWVAEDGADGLMLDVTGSAHLFGGEVALLADIRLRLMRARLTVRLGLAETRGAAWALARFGEGVAAPGEGAARLAALPVAALRLDPAVCVRLERLGLRKIGDLAALPRATLARRFGPGLMARLDQVTGVLPEPVSPAPEAPFYGTRLTLPEPIGLSDDVMAGVARLLGPLCEKLGADEKGARRLVLTVRRVDQAASEVELRLARPMRDAARLLRLFEKGIGALDAGYGIDQLRLQATEVERLPVRQISHHRDDGGDEASADLITRLGARLGLEAVTRLLPADSYIPERSTVVAAAAFSPAAQHWPEPAQPRPLILFPAEPVAARLSHAPPAHFRWRGMGLTSSRAMGPERIAPEWWLEDENWRSGVRDYWQVETREGRRLWLFYTPQCPGWFAQGEFA